MKTGSCTTKKSSITSYLTIESDKTMMIKPKTTDRVRQNRAPYLAAFLLPLLICVVICICNGVYPFGENCILHVDMYHQYCPFFTELLRKLQDGESLMYSWNLGLGSDFVSLYAYYLASPLNWLLLLCPRAHVIEFMTLLILVKIALSGLSFFFYLKEHYGLIGRDGRFHKQTALPAQVFALAYALSGFVAAYSWDIMWLDCIALFPVIMVGLERLVKKGEILLYYVSLAVCIFANYYISIMICMFLVFYFVLLFVREGQSAGRWRLPALGRFALCSTLAGGTSAVLLLPEIFVLSASGSIDGGFPGKAQWYFHLIAELGRGAATAKVYTGNDHWPNLYAGAFSLMLVWLYLLNRRISWKEKLPRLCMLCFFLISFAQNQLDYIWHGMHFPQSLPARQSFLYIFLLLSVGFATVRKWKGVRRGQIVESTVFALLLLLAASVFLDEAVTAHSAYLITALLLLLYGMLLLLTKLVSASTRQLLMEFLVGIAVFELALNMGLTGFSVTSRTDYVKKQEAYGRLLDLAKERENGGFFRVEDTGRKTKNDDALYGYASATIFSSLMNLNVSHFYQSLYMEGGKNFYSYNGSTPLTSALLSVKYYLSDNAMEENVFRTLVGQEDGCYLYENSYCLPPGYMVEEAVIADWEPDMKNRAASLNALAYALGAENELLTGVVCGQETKEGITELTIPESGFYYAACDVCGADSLTVSRSDGWSQRYSKTTHRYILALGDCEAKETVQIRNTVKEEIRFTLYRMDAQAVRQAFETLNRQTFTVDAVTETSVSGHIAVEQAGRLVFAIPADEGWRVYVDGEAVNPRPWQDALLAVELTEGDHEVRLRYTTPWLLPGACISGLCVFTFLLYALWRNRRKLRWRNESV
ncbi:MAG: YfhO family protein [Roseburia sp.]|nr:YfhO family protein [Roseburia sp.]MCM1430235.1 YfhO family protein [Muribaculaceae bacterium]